MINIKTIVETYLKENKFNGLVQNDMECSCEVGNLVPCDKEIGFCEPAYKVLGCPVHKVPGCADDCSEGCEYHMTTVKPARDPLQKCHTYSCEQPDTD